MADPEQLRIKEEFAKNLKAEEYIPFMTQFWNDLPELFRFMMKFLHQIFDSERFKGSKLLEIGSGATVHSIAAASAYFPNITMSDYVQDNIHHLKLWLQGKSDLQQFLDIQAGLEGYGNDLEMGIKILESRIRKTVKLVTRSDVLTDKILLGDSKDPETSPPFDVVIACLTLEVAPKDFDEYTSCLKRIHNILRTGGALIMCGFFQGSKWSIGDKEFHHIQFGKRELLDSLLKTGFGKIDIKTLNQKGLKDIKFKYNELFCVATEKL